VAALVTAWHFAGRDIEKASIESAVQRLGRINIRQRLQRPAK
jgi:hypothetical protein